MFTHCLYSEVMLFCVVCVQYNMEPAAAHKLKLRIATLECDMNRSVLYNVGTLSIRIYILTSTYNIGNFQLCGSVLRMMPICMCSFHICKILTLISCKQN